MGGLPYSAAKAGVRNLMGHIHSEHRQQGIRCTTILPAEVDTPLVLAQVLGRQWPQSDGEMGSSYHVAKRRVELVFVASDDHEEHAILVQRPLPPGSMARATMMQPEDVARAVMFCVLLPARTVVEEIVMVPTVQRDVSEDIRVAARTGGPEA